MGILANKIITGNQIVYEKPEEVKPPPKVEEPRSKISAGRIIQGSKVVYEKPTEKPEVIKKPRTGSKISAGRIIQGVEVVFEKTIEDDNIIKSLAQLRASNKMHKMQPEKEEELVSIDKRLSSYFLIQKESDYLDHNKNI